MNVIDAGYCFECDAGPVAVVEIGEHIPFETGTTKACKECLRKALELIEGANPVS